MSKHIGVDIGGTAIKAGVFDDKGNIISSKEIPTRADDGYEAVLGDIYDLMIELTEAASGKKNIRENGFSEIDSIGIGIPGLVDTVRGKILSGPNLGWTDKSMGEELTNMMGKVPVLANDATLAAYAESILGVTKGCKNSFFLTLGTGVGGGMIINSEIYSGSHFVGSEIGHMIIGENFYNCSCGRNGCFETFASATALVKYVEYKLDEFKDQPEYSFLENEATKSCLGKHREDGILTSKIIFEESKKGDWLAIEAVERLVKYLAIGILNIYDILDPDIIAIGGGLSKAGSYLIELINKELENKTLLKSIEYGKITLATLGNDAGMIGAALFSAHKAE